VGRVVTGGLLPSGNGPWVTPSPTPTPRAPGAEPEPTPTPRPPGAEPEPVPDGGAVAPPTTETPDVPNGATVIDKDGKKKDGKENLLEPFTADMPFSVFFTVDGYTTSVPTTYSYTAGEGCEVLDTKISTNLDKLGNLIISTETEVRNTANGDTFIVKDPFTMSVKPAIDIKPYNVGVYGGETSLVKSAVAQRRQSVFMQSILR
jgi:hypothetical protein